jgi:hypothetical protein
MDILLRLTIGICLIGMLRSSERFRQMSRDIDEAVIIVLKRFMNVAEDSGFPREIVPVFLVLTALTFMFLVVTTGGGR